MSKPPKLRPWESVNVKVSKPPKLGSAHPWESFTATYLSELLLLIELSDTDGNILSVNLETELSIWTI